jgi:multiple sugar transport system substrate-binding protein
MKSSRYIILLVLASLLLAACGAPGGAPAPADTGTVPAEGEAAATVEPGGGTVPAPAAEGAAISGELSVLGMTLSDEIGTVRVDAFKEAYPDVQVNMSEGALDPQQFLTAVASGNPPDIIYTTRDELSTYATRGAIVPLEQCIADQGIDMSQFRESAVSQVTVDGSVYGIPEFFNVVVVIVNNAAMEEAGLALEELDMSDWDSIAAFNEATTKMDGDTLVRIGFDPKLPEFLPLWAKANGADLLSADGRTAQLDDPRVVEALEFTVGLHEAAGGRENFMAFRDTWDFFGGQNQFVSDQLGAFPMEQWYLNVLTEASPDVSISVIPFLDREGNPITFATGNTFAIPQGAKNEAAACAFMKTMTDPATWERAAQARADARAAEGLPFTGTYTGNRAADEVIFGQIRQDSGNAMFESAVETVLSVQDQAFSIPANPAGAEFRQAWVDAVNRALSGEQTAAEALAQAQQEAQQALDEAWSR